LSESDYTALLIGTQDERDSVAHCAIYNHPGSAYKSCYPRIELVMVVESKVPGGSHNIQVSADGNGINSTKDALLLVNSVGSSAEEF